MTIRDAKAKLSVSLRTLVKVGSATHLDPRMSGTQEYRLEWNVRRYYSFNQRLVTGPYKEIKDIRQYWLQQLLSVLSHRDVLDDQQSSVCVS